MSDQHHHRSLFSSKNRPFKGKSKGKTEKLNRGKVDDKSHLASGRSNSSASRSSVNATNFSTNTPGAHRIPLKHSIELGSKDARALRAKQLQRNAREQLFQKKRIGNRQGPPKIVALVPLGGSVDVLKIVQAVQAYADGTQEGVKEEMKKVEKSTNPLLSTIAVNMSGRQRRITLYATPRDTNAVLDIAKVADIVMFVVGTAPAQANAGAQQQEDIDIDAFGTHVLAILKAQGMPACMGMQVGTASAAPKKQAALRKLAGRYFDTACGEGTKLIQMDGVADAANFFRWIAADVKLKPIAWRDARPYMLAEQVAFEQNQVAPSLFSFTPAGAQPVAPATSSEPTGTLRIRGYLRGENPLQASQLLHLTGFGDFQIEKVEGRVEEAQVYQTEKTKAKSRAASKAASKMGSRRGSIGDDEDMGDAASPSPVAAAAAASTSSLAQSSVNSSDVVLVTSSPSTQESLLSLNPIDPLATVNGEQSYIGEDEYEHDGVHDEEDGDQEMGDDEERKAYDMDDDEDADGDAGMRDVDQSGRTIESGRRKKFADQEIRPAITASQLRAASKPGALIRSQVAWDAAVPDDDNDGGAEGREADAAFGDERDADMQPDPFIQKKKLERDEVDFPDEVEFPMDTRCKERFARYRGLKSFLHSAWDSKENLPAEYAQIFQFANFEASKNRVLKDAILAGTDPEGEESVVLGQRFYPVTIYLKDVPVSVAQVVCTTLSPICAFGVFKYEHKVSLLHFSIKRMEEYQAPIKAKEPMEFHVAFRRFVARPIYSVEGKGEKSMTKRFFHRGDFLVASVYGRIVFPPASVICFKPNQEISTLMVQRPEERVPGQLQRAMLQESLTQTATPFTPIVASGTLLSVNPDRLLIKRIILTGTPISVHKRNAVVRHMFFNADDVRWFKPVELTTKYGLVGHVKESRGTKGYMKCEFDKFIKQNDTVCMALYKRQYPPWNEELFAGHL